MTAAKFTTETNQIKWKITETCMIKSASHFWDALGCAKQRTNFYFDHYGNGLNVQLMIEQFFNKALDFQ